VILRRHRVALAASAAGLLALLAGGTAAAVPHATSGSTASAATAHDGTAVPNAAGSPGYCPNKQGVTVVVDFNQLGGGIVVRCAPGPIGSNYTGIDALEGAGFDPEGTKRWGLEFVCRIAGKPAADQKLHIKGDPNYKEACIDTPPASAFWSYWYAPNGGTWSLSDEGPLDRDVIAGGFEGWSFSLNHTADTAPAPGIAPVRPQQPPPTTTPPPTTPPTQPSTPPTRAPHTGGGGSHHGTGAGGTGSRGSGSGGSGGSRSDPSVPPTATRPVTTASPPSGPVAAGRRGHGGARSRPAAYGSTLSIDPPSGSTDNPLAVGHNAAGEKVSGALPSTGLPVRGSPRRLILAVLVLAALAAGAFATWRRRSGPR
jgi:hypothetical protein